MKEMKPDDIIYLGKNTMSVMRGTCPVCRINVYRGCNYCCQCGTKLIWPSIQEMEEKRKKEDK